MSRSSACTTPRRHGRQIRRKMCGPRTYTYNIRALGGTFSSSVVPDAWIILTTLSLRKKERPQLIGYCTIILITDGCS